MLLLLLSLFLLLLMLLLFLLDFNEPSLKRCYISPPLFAAPGVALLAADAVG
jgi:hypothetical protein